MGKTQQLKILNLKKHQKYCYYIFPKSQQLDELGHTLFIYGNMNYFLFDFFFLNFLFLFFCEMFSINSKIDEF